MTDASRLQMFPSMPLRRILFLIAIAISGDVHTVRANKLHDTHERQSIKMYKYKAASPLSPDKFEAGGENQDWYVHAASYPLADKIVLNPSIPERYGLFFNVHMLDTQDFTVKFDVMVRGNILDDQGFGFFYTKQNFVETYRSKSPEQQGLSWKQAMILAENTYFGHSARFRGFGVIFTKAGIHCVEGKDTPLSAGDFRRPNFMEFTNKKTSIRIEVSYWGTEVFATIEGVEKQVCNLRSSGPLIESYMGFTSYTGGSPDSVSKPAAVYLDNIDTINHDEHHMGEEMDSLREYELDDLLKEDHLYKEGHTPAIQKLKSVLESYVEKNDYWPMLTKLTTVQENLHRVEASAQHLDREIKLLNHKSGHASLNSMKDDLLGLQSVLHKQAHQEATSRNSIRSQHKAVHDDFEQLFAGNNSHEHALSMANSVFLMMFCIFLALVLVVGGIWKTMRNYEKKHFL